MSSVPQKKDMDEIEGPWSPEENEMLLNLFEKHGRNWSLITMMIDSDNVQEFVGDEFGSRNSFHEENSSDEIGGVVSGQAPSIGDIAMDNVSQPSRGTHSYSRDQLAPSWNALNKQDSSRMMIDSDNVQAFVGGEIGSQNIIYEGNSSQAVGGVVNGQGPSISDMARGNMSSGGTHSFSRDHSAPSWNALYIRDSSPMMIESDSVQQFVGGEFGRNDFSEVSSTSLLQGKGW